MTVNFSTADITDELWQSDKNFSYIDPNNY